MKSLFTKDLIKRILISSISGLLLGYLGYLLLMQQVIVTTEFARIFTNPLNILYYIVLIIACLYLFIMFGLVPVHVKMTKASLFVLGLSLIILADGVLVNDIVHRIYLQDLFKIIGVVLTLLAWTNVLVTDQAKKKTQDAKIEIIEV